MATVMHDQLDVPPHVVEAILNHVSGHKAGVAGVYNRAKYLAPMRQALVKWADFVDRLVASYPNVGAAYLPPPGPDGWTRLPDGIVKCPLPPDFPPPGPTLRVVPKT
jgi:hypothetical protein